jgi:hypothetical protein
MVQWVTFTPEIVDQEIQAAMWRNRIEEVNFRYDTYEELTADMHQKLSKDEYYQHESQKYSVVQHRKEMNEVMKTLKKSSKRLEMFNIKKDGFEV